MFLQGLELPMSYYYFKQWIRSQVGGNPLSETIMQFIALRVFNYCL